MNAFEKFRLAGLLFLVVGLAIICAHLDAPLWERVTAVFCTFIGVWFLGASDGRSQ